MWEAVLGPEHPHTATRLNNLGSLLRDQGDTLYLIKPRKTHPHLALSVSNCQILCSDCNKGKGNWDDTDWR
jgi:5-methylcytosine-specific restriction endonuclease McrA